MDPPQQHSSHSTIDHLGEDHSCFASLHQNRCSFSLLSEQMTTSPIKFVGGASLQKELQGFAGFIAYQECCRKGTSSTLGTMESRIGKYYFGNPDDPDSIGLGEQLIHGNGVFAGLYTHEEIANVVATRDSSQLTMHQQYNPTVLVLKPSLHCLSNDKRVIVGPPGSMGITLSLILANGLKNSSHITNRTLYCRALEHVKNGKKALSIVMHADSPYRAHVATGNLPSGMNLDDYYLYVRQGMYDLLHGGASAIIDTTSSQQQNQLPTMSEAITGAPNTAESDRNEEHDRDGSGSLMTTSTTATANNTSSVVVMPNSWTFTGFIIFALLGPFVPSVMSSYKSEILMTTPSDDDDTTIRTKRKKNDGTSTTPARGRTATRKQAALESVAESLYRKEARTTEASASGVAPNHSCRVEGEGTQGQLTMNQKITLAGIAQSKAMIEHRERSQIGERIISMNKKRVAGQKLLINEHKFLIQHTPADDPQCHLYMQELRSMNQELGNAIRTLRTSEQDIIDQAMFDVESRKTKASEFVDLTIATALDCSSPSEFNIVAALDCSSPSELSSQALLTLPSPSTAFIPLTKNKNKRVFSTLSSVSPLEESDNHTADVNIVAQVTTSTNNNNGCIECNLPSNHSCRKCKKCVCSLCCAEKRELENAWWCNMCFKKQTVASQQLIRDGLYYSSDKED